MPQADIDIQMRRLRRRVRVLMAERCGLYGAAIGTVIAAALVLLSSKYDALLDRRLWLGAVLLGAIAGVVVGLVRRLSDLAVAMAADARTGLQERVSTAVVLKRSGKVDEMAAAEIEDAQERMSGVRPSDVFRRRWGMPHGALGLAVVILLCAIYVPMMPAFQSKTRRAEVQAMKREGAKLVTVAKEMKRYTPTKQEALRRLANRLQDLGKKMEMGRMQKKQAMLQTRKLSKEIKQEQDRLAKQNQHEKSMEAAQLDMRKASEDLAKEMAQKLAAEKKIPLDKAMAQLPDDKVLKELARKEGPLTPAEQKMLEDAVSKYADPKNGLPIPPELGEAIAKLAANKDYQKAAELVQKMLQKLDLERLQKLAKSGKMSKMDQEALKKQMEALAKALKGTDLDKLAKMLKDQAEMLAKLSPEELQELVEQLMMAQALAKAGGT